MSNDANLPSEELKRAWIEEEDSLRARLIVEDRLSSSIDELQYVGGVDISFIKDDNVNACAALVVLQLPDLKVVYERFAMVELTAPYVPGFLAFREVSHLVQLVSELKDNQPELVPQVILVDGNGVLHHRSFGLACHLGVLTDIPTIGVGKNLLCVDGLEREAIQALSPVHLHQGGDSFPLVGTSGRTLGAAVRCVNTSTNPVFVSIGHKVTLATAVAICCKTARHKLPEPVRQADLRSRDYLKQREEQASS
eukprot:TRINITY_DN9278_c0_g1_i1.p3 TRINITY_DN9278_c0_g1~~TRINITY_DN9278_c0_g1_i1.p3  ORF type:complete len:252 (+),score=46.54 TRINITY_DN9278_c0_g1_i1:4753-5508(+)